MSNKKIEFSTPWFEIESEEYDLPHLKGEPIYRMNRPESVMVVALTKSKEIVFIKQFRPTINEWTLELPAGAIGKGEDKKAAAAREFLEETGYVCEDLEYVGSGRVAVDRINSRAHIFFGWNAAKSDKFLSEDGVEVKLMSFEELKKFASSDKFHYISGLGSILLTYWKLAPKELAGLF